MIIGLNELKDWKDKILLFIFQYAKLYFYLVQFYASTRYLDGLVYFAFFNFCSMAL